MSPDEIKALRKSTGLAQRDFAAALELEPSVVRDWETGERFPTKAHCEAMEALRANPPPKVKGKNKKPMQVLADPGFFTVVRKLLAHGALRAQVEKLASEYPDPVDDEG